MDEKKVKGRKEGEIKKVVVTYGTGTCVWWTGIGERGKRESCACNVTYVLRTEGPANVCQRRDA